MAERRPGKTRPKRSRPTGDEIARTPEYQALLADLSALIAAAKAGGVIRPRKTMRDLRRAPRRKGVGDET